MKFTPAALALLTLCVAVPPAFAQAESSAANFETRLSSIEDMSRTLNGEMEQMNYAIRRLDQSVQRMQADYDARLTRLEAQVTQMATAPAPVVVPPQDVSGSLGTIKTNADGQVIGAVKNPKAPPLPDTPADYGLTVQEQYDQAFTLLRQAKYDEAEKAFKTFIDKNPKDKLIDNAKYWFAETLYVRARFNDAAVAFADAFQQNPQGAKAPDCLLKLSMSLAAIDKTQDACVALAELRGKYPDASASVRSRAAEEQAKLKCSSH